jgi:Flp pilus assembly protein TadG
MASASRGRRRGGVAGVGLVEFALVSPLLVLLVMGIVVTGVVVTNQIQLTNAVRQGARAAAVCGGIARASSTTLPNGQACTSAALVNYVGSSLNAVPGTVSLNVTVINGNSLPNDPNVLDECEVGKTIVVDASFAQPLYLPLVGRLVGDGGGNVRTLTASAEATCEQ